VEQLPLFLQMVETVLHQKRIENQPAIDATVNDRIGRQFRLPFFDHEAFALLTGHGLPPAPMIRDVETDSIRKAQ
jgi:hypothetical protein